ncbi:MAG TPA: hypothetical protein VL992_14315, partial [Tepidisphaeraceae bacterium]|nr:hypothetical protein [Tepidisphaeraceae bacterium]
MKLDNGVFPPGRPGIRLQIVDQILLIRLYPPHEPSRFDISRIRHLELTFTPPANPSSSSPPSDPARHTAAAEYTP